MQDLSAPVANSEMQHDMAIEFGRSNEDPKSNNNSEVQFRATTERSQPMHPRDGPKEQTKKNRGKAPIH